MPQDRKGRKAVQALIEACHVQTVKDEECVFHTSRRQMIPLAPRLPTVRSDPSSQGLVRVVLERNAGTLQNSISRSDGCWTLTGEATWRGNHSLLSEPSARRLPKYWDLEDDDLIGVAAGGTGKKSPGIRSRSSTEDEKQYQFQLQAGFLPEESMQAQASITEEEDSFGYRKLGFPTERRPATDRRPLRQESPSQEFREWIARYPNMVGCLVDTNEKMTQVLQLLETWRDVFCEIIKDMPKTDLIEHRIPTYNNAVPKVARPVLYSAEEEQWMALNIPKLVEAGIISQCISPWSARTRFPPKEDGSLRMVHAFVPVNKVTIKANMPMRRIEPVLKRIAQPYLTHMFKVDGSNAYWAVGLFALHKYKLAFATSIGQYCYERMGQGCTGAPGTYTQLKSIVTSAIPSPNPEPALADAMPGRATFDHFVDDDIGGADSFSSLIEFLHEHYFPRLIWARLTLNPKKCSFFAEKVKILGHQRTSEGIRPSEHKLGQFEHWPRPTTKDELARFLNTLPFFKAFIPGRAEYSRILKSAVIEESVTVKRNGKQTTTKTAVDFKWTNKHEQAFNEVKQAILNNACIGGDEKRQYHLCTDASKTGAGGVLFQLRTGGPDTQMSKSNWEDIGIIMFLSYQFTPAQTRYQTTERETLAVVKSLAEVRWLVKGSQYPVMLYTDHSALLTTLESEDATGRIARWQLALSEYDLNIFHVPGKEIAIADGMSRIIGYPSQEATSFENTMASFCVDVEAGDNATVGRQEAETRRVEEAAWELKMAEWLDDPWYATIVGCKHRGDYNERTVLGNASRKVTEKLASRFQVIEDDTNRPELCYLENDGRRSRCLHEPEVKSALEIIHNVHGHFSDGVTLKRCIGKFWWPTRAKDILKFCRSCPNCQMIGPLKARTGLMPVVSIAPMDLFAFDYIGPFTPISRSGNRFILIGMDYMTRFLIAEAYAQANSANSTAFLDEKVADKLGYPRASYQDNGSHFKRHFAARLAQMGIKQMDAPISHPQSVGLAERYVQLILKLLRAVLQCHPEAIFDWDLYLQAIVRAINVRLVKVFGFSPAKLMLGFEPRYVTGMDDYEDVLRSRGVLAEIERLMTVDSMTVEHAAYDNRMAIFDELRQLALKKRLEHAEADAEKTAARSKSTKETLSEKISAERIRPIKKGDLVRLRRLQQDNQHSHKLEPRWGGPHLVTETTFQGRSVVLKCLVTDKILGRFSVDDVELWIEREEYATPGQNFMSVATMNRQTQAMVKEWMKTSAKQRKEMMNAQGKDSTDVIEEGPDVRDPRNQQRPYPSGYGDEADYSYWKRKAVDLQRPFELWRRM